MTSIPDLYAQRIIREYHEPLERLPDGIPSLSHLVSEDLVHEAAKKDSQSLSIGVIGAGAAGLFIGMTLEKVNAYLESVGWATIKYEILEAETTQGGHPVGGRLWTHRFSNSKNDYYDRGAMRFPDNPTQQPLMRFFTELGLDNLKIPYIMSTLSNANLFNSRNYTNDQLNIFTTNKQFDPFATGIPELTGTVDDMVNDHIGVFRDAFKRSFDEGWNMLMESDQYSTRAYMTIKGTEGVGTYSDRTVDYLETFSTGTGLFNQALSETVMDSLQFDYPKDPDDPDFGWWSIQGGSSVIADAMASKIPKSKILNGRRVAGLYPGIKWVSHRLKLVGVDVRVDGEGTKDRRYDHVVSTIPFGALRMVDTSWCGFSWDLRSAIRSLAYDSSTKVGIKFKERWWEKLSQPQFGGSSTTDLATRVIVYPSYGIGGNDATMIVSYTWAQDAARQGSLAGGKEKERLLIDVILRDLTEIHRIDDYDYLPSLVVDWDVFSWYNNENSLGAFALFGPGQFARLYREVTKPAIGGRLHFAGEITSPFHAWVLGALRSASRALKEIIITEDAKKTFGSYGRAVLGIVDKAFDNPELDHSMITKQVALGISMKLDLETINSAMEKFVNARK